MKKAKYVIYCCLLIAAFVIGIVLKNLKPAKSNTINSKINVNCAQEISIPVNSEFEMKDNAVEFEKNNLSNFNISIYPKSRKNKGGLVFENNKFRALMVGSYEVYFSLNNQSIAESIIINVVKNSINSDCTLYVNNPQPINEVVDLADNHSAYVENEDLIELSATQILPKEAGKTRLVVESKFDYYKIMQYIAIEIKSIDINENLTYEYNFVFDPDEIYTMQFKLTDKNLTATNQKLLSIDYDENLVEIVSFDSPILNIQAKCACTTTIKLTFRDLPQQIEFNVHFE